jgi:predicted Holliday junction resolvase-like endonuclease
MVRYIVFAFLFYILYRFIVDLVIPVGKASKQVRSKMKEMQEQQYAQQREFRAQQEMAVKKEEEQRAKKESDYIDFEEIKG